MITIGSKSNSKYKLAKSLLTSKFRNKERKYICEGLRAVELAIEFNARIDYILVSETFSKIDKNNEFIENLSKNKNLYILSDILFDDISTTENSQGIVAVIDMKKSDSSVFNMEKHSKIIVLDRVQDPGNMGTIIRTADAAGFDLVFITKGCVDIYNPKVVRSTMGSLMYMDIIIGEQEEIANLLIKNDVQIVSSYLQTDNYYNNASYREKVALVVGNEANGINDFWIENSDLLVKIPMYGKAESLNVAISSAILMYNVNNVVNTTEY